MIENPEYEILEIAKKLEALKTSSFTFTVPDGKVLPPEFRRPLFTALRDAWKATAKKLIAVEVGKLERRLKMVRARTW